MSGLTPEAGEAWARAWAAHEEAQVRRSAEMRPGSEEGQACGRAGCDGTIEFRPPDECTCHINPPCSSCVSAREWCPACGWRAEDDE